MAQEESGVGAGVWWLRWEGGSGDTVSEEGGPLGQFLPPIPQITLGKSLHQACERGAARSPHKVIVKMRGEM